MGVLLEGKEIFDKIEQARLEKSMSKIKLAKEVGMSPSNFYDTMALLLRDRLRYKILNFFNFFKRKIRLNLRLDIKNKKD